MALRFDEVWPHGGGIEAAARRWGCAAEDVLDLSTGLHPDGPPVWLAEWLARHAHLAGRYPDADGEPARSALAEALGVPASCVLVAAGAQALIEVAVQAMGWRSLAIEVPCYAEPIRCARRAGCAVRAFGPGDAPPAAEARWITSPHNPDGGLRPLPNAWRGVLDESYMPWMMRQGLGVLSGVVRIGSLTKLFCLPGLPLGYAVAEEDLLARLRRWLSPWPASTPALHLAPALLKEIEGREARLTNARERMMGLLARAGWQARASSASFVLARPAHERMPDFAAARILVRAFPEWPQLAGWARLGFPGREAIWARIERLLLPHGQRLKMQRVDRGNG
ncbi:MAG: aminotransferase class I/II-fold pyridoxal phosphate-dependent enzyme [Mariprofundaceae bacterium]